MTIEDERINNKKNYFMMRYQMIDLKVKYNK